MSNGPAPEETTPAERSRAAIISFHTSPLDQPGTGDSGGMNVYIHEAAERLSRQGVEVDIFTRCRGADLPEVEAIDGGWRGNLEAGLAGEAAAFQSLSKGEDWHEGMTAFLEKRRPQFKDK